MKHIAIAAFAILLLTRCSPDRREVPPSVAKLVGAWQLTGPDSSYAVTLRLALNPANPPKDITHFEASGQSAVNSYNAFLSAAVDGLMVVTSVNATERGGPLPAMQAEQTYFTNLRAVVRYDMPSDNQLRLYFGGVKPGVLAFRRV